VTWKWEAKNGRDECMLPTDHEMVFVTDPRPFASNQQHPCLLAEQQYFTSYIYTIARCVLY
jgi:hypothetical protein